MLEDEPDIEVAGEAGSAMECLRQIFEYAPELVIADAKTFGLSAVETEMLIERESPGTKLVFLDTDQKKNSSSVRPCEMERFATRQTSMEELVVMVREVCGLERANISEGEDEHSSVEHSEHRALTAREQEVLKLLAEGKTVRAAASDLGVSSKTVDAHKFNLMRKLGIHNKADLVMWAIQKKVVKVPAEL
jgi:two-component system response regulator NreC